MIQVMILTLIILSILRILLGPTIWDRLLGFNLMTSKVSILIIVLAFIQDASYMLDIAITYTLLSFIGSIFIAKYIERRELS